MANENQAQDNRLSVSIGDGKTFRVDSVRVNGDVFDSDGNLIERGRFLELNTEQVAAFGSENIQPFADTYFGVENSEAASNE